MSPSTFRVWRFRNVEGKVDAVMFNELDMWNRVEIVRLLKSMGVGL
jgi:hypothetical protein